MTLLFVCMRNFMELKIGDLLSIRLVINLALLTATWVLVGKHNKSRLALFGNKHL